ncbi:MAG: 5'-3' exonuclease H3TH domain-containing protein, partial [Candidatus Veblenbacteria bacterium]|nr:5'-3' exonuclease H3TH domain-containing protein [Candidatus Veblenbacteria bacterium]
FGVPIFEAKGYEADDVIGTVTKAVAETGTDSVIVTGDLDTLQLVDEHTSVYTLRQGLADTITYTPAAVYDRYGLKPEQLVEFRALKGDPSDNIPGVRGIGEKTAAELIKKFGSVAALYSSLKKNAPAVKKLSPRLRELLLTSQEQAVLARQLSEIVRTVPLDFSLEACRLKGFNLPKLAELFHQLEFKTLLARLPELGAKLNLVSGPAPVPSAALIAKRKAAAGRYELVATPEGLEKAVKVLSQTKELAVDTETSSLEARHADLVGISLSAKPGEAYYVAASLAGSPAWAKLGKLLADATLAKVAHNAKFDTHVLRHAGLALNGLTFDTLLAAYLLQGGERVLDLKSLVYQELGVEMTPITALLGERGKNQKSMLELAPQEVKDYACADADYTLRLKHKFEPELKSEGVGKLFDEVEVPLVVVLAD